VRKALRPMTPRALVHRTGLRGELRWWRGYIERGGGDWPEDLHQRLDPDAPLAEPLIADRLERFEGGPVRVLDVGAGPISSLGKTHGDLRLEITAVDPLGEEYSRLLADAGIEPVIPTLTCRGEDVARRFGAGAFEVAYSRNALDHSADPVAAVRAMVGTVVPQGFVALRHYRNEAENSSYVQLHNWNFDVEAGSLFIWGPYGRYDLSAELADEVTVRCWLEEGSGPTPWVCAILDRDGDRQTSTDQ
jgi:hypothetical protein